MRMLIKNKSFIMLAVLALYSFYLFKFSERHFGGNISGFLYIGGAHIHCPEAWYPGLYVRSDAGFDGEFNYYIAIDPLLKKGIYQCSGGGAYRYQRILLPILASALSLGNMKAVPYAIVGINLLSILMGMWFVIKCCEHLNVSLLMSLFFSLSVGTLVALTRSTTELLYCALLIAGFYSYSVKNRYLQGALFFSLAILAKELAVTAVTGLLMYELIFKRELRSLKYLIIPLLVFLLWQLYVYGQFHHLSFHSNLASQSATYYPLKGLVDKLIAVIPSAGSLSVLRLCEPVILLNIFLAVALIIYSLKNMNNPFPVVGLLYIAIVHIGQTVPPSANDLYGYGRHTAELFICLIFLYLFQKRKIFLAPLLINSIIAFAVALAYIV